jgi:hypothetical protein
MKYLKSYEHNIQKIENKTLNNFKNDVYKLYCEFIINKFFENIDIADVRLELLSHNPEYLTIDLYIEFFTFDLRRNLNYFDNIKNFCEFIKKIGNYNFYVKESEDDSIFGINVSIHTDGIEEIERLMKAKKYNIGL